MQQPNTVTLALPSNYVGQLLDGLDVLIEQWEYTAVQLGFGVMREDMLIRECSDAHEARKIADFYRRIQDSIEQQCGNSDDAGE